MPTAASSRPSAAKATSRRVISDIDVVTSCMVSVAVVSRRATSASSSPVIAERMPDTAAADVPPSRRTARTTSRRGSCAAGTYS